MPVLSAYIGISSVSMFLYKSSEKHCFVNFPYVYSPNLFQNYLTPEQFYLDVFTRFSDDSGFNLSNSDLYITSFIENINKEKMGPFVKEARLVSDVIDKLGSCFPILVNNYSVVAPGIYLSKVEAREHGKSIYDQPEEADFYANLGIYPQLRSVDLTSQVNLDKNVLSNCGGLQIDAAIERPLVFLGERFMGGGIKELDYVFALSMVCSSGVYELKIDRNNSQILLDPLRSLSMVSAVENTLENVGTLVSVNGAAECSIKTDDGSVKVLDVLKDSLLLVPLADGSEAEIYVKNSYQNIEKRVRGGTLGIIFDTRLEKRSLYADVKLFNKALKLVGAAMEAF